MASSRRATVTVPRVLVTRVALALVLALPVALAAGGVPAATALQQGTPDVGAQGFPGATATAGTLPEDAVGLASRLDPASAFRAPLDPAAVLALARDLVDRKRWEIGARGQQQQQDASLVGVGAGTQPNLRVFDDSEDDYPVQEQASTAGAGKAAESETTGSTTGRVLLSFKPNRDSEGGFDDVDDFAADMESVDEDRQSLGSFLERSKRSRLLALAEAAARDAGLENEFPLVFEYQEDFPTEGSTHADVELTSKGLRGLVAGPGRRGSSSAVRWDRRRLLSANHEEAEPVRPESAFVFDNQSEDFPGDEEGAVVLRGPKGLDVNDPAFVFDSSLEDFPEGDAQEELAAEERALSDAMAAGREGLRVRLPGSWTFLWERLAHLASAADTRTGNPNLSGIPGAYQNRHPQRRLLSVPEDPAEDEAAAEMVLQDLEDFQKELKGHSWQAGKGGYTPYTPYRGESVRDLQRMRSGAGDGDQSNKWGLGSVFEESEGAEDFPLDFTTAEGQQKGQDLLGVLRRLRGNWN